MSRSVLPALAILKVNWDRLGRDYLQNFVPIVVECIRSQSEDIVSLPDLQATIRSDFGLALPLNSIRLVLQRAVKDGYVRRQSGVFYRDKQACESTDFYQTQQRVGAIYDAVLSKLRQYALDNHSISWTEEEADVALSEFLRDNSLSLLFELAEKTQVAGNREHPGEAYVVGSFVVSASTSEPRVMEDIEVLLKGNLLLNAIYLPDQGKVAQKFRNTRVYLDTSIVAFAAGFAGAHRAEPCLELIELLKENGADLFCLRITFEELRGILDACASRLRRGDLRDAYGPSIEYFLETGKSASDVELMAARLPHKLRSLGIVVDDKPPYDVEYQVDEAGLEAVLQSEIGYTNPRARVHDVDCVSAIARLRRGRQSNAPETSHALFVTQNSLMAKVVRQFFQKDVSPGTVALCLTDYALANLLWLKNPTKAPQLARRRLLADAYAAMQPPEHLWKAYLAEIARLETDGNVSAEEYYVLRHSLSAKAALMELTQGVPEAFSEGTTQEVLEIAKEHLRSDLTQKLTSERRLREASEAQVLVMREANVARRQRLRGVSQRISRWISRLTTTAVFLLLLIALAYTFPWNLPPPSDATWRYLQSSVVALLFFATAANLLWGTTIRSVSQRMEGHIADKLTSWLIRFAHADEEPESSLPPAA